MVKTRVTRLGKIFLALMLLFYGAAVTSQSGLLLLLIGLIGGCFAVNWTFSRRNAANLNLNAPRDVSLVEGSALAQPWTLENRSTKHIEMIEAWDKTELLFRVPLVEVNDVISVLPRVTYDRRGVYPHSRVAISSAAPFGLLRSIRTIELPGEVVVLPRVYETISPAGTGHDLISGGKFRGRRRVNSGAHFAGVRSWEPGDALKQVHWKTTARRGELMVKTFEEELGGRVSLLLDCESADSALVDDAVRAAASLAVATLQDGHHLELITSGDAFAALRLAPFGDESELLQRLARYNPNTSSHEPDLSMFWRRSVLAIIGTRFRPAWMHLMDHAEQQNRTIHLFLREKIEYSRLNAEVWEFSADQIFASEPAEFSKA